MAKNQGIQSKNKREVGNRTGAPRERIRPTGTAQWGQAQGNHFTEPGRDGRMSSGYGGVKAHTSSERRRRRAWNWQNHLQNRLSMPHWRWWRPGRECSARQRRHEPQMTIDDIDPDLIPLVKALNTRVGQLRAEIDAKEKHKAALESECTALQRSLDVLRDQRIELQKAVNAEKAELVRTQSAIIDKTKLLEETEAKLKKIAGWKAA